MKLDANGESKCEESKTFAGELVFCFVDTCSSQMEGVKYSFGYEFEVCVWKYKLLSVHFLYSLLVYT